SGATAVNNAAKPMIAFLDLLTPKPNRFIKASDIHPPSIFEIPNAKKGTQNRDPITSYGTLRSAARYFGIQNIKKYNTGSNRNRITLNHHTGFIFSSLDSEIAGIRTCGRAVRLLFFGIANHITTHSKPTIPGITKLHLHPYHSEIQMVSGGATTAPIAAPPIAMPLANARSFSSNHSKTARAAPGKHPPSPAP